VLLPDFFPLGLADSSPFEVPDLVKFLQVEASLVLKTPDPRLEFF
jgi:hypothetical protein